jgi:hypothetical protein
MRWAGHVARIGKVRNTYRIFGAKPEGKRPFRGPRVRSDDNIRINLREIGYGIVDWIHLAQDRNQWRLL